MVSSVSSSTPDGTYKIGDVIAVTVTFDEIVTVSGTPQITLETGTTDAVVNYTSGTGTNTLTFNYTIVAGSDVADLDYTTTTALALNGGAIGDQAGNVATLTLATPGAAGSLGNAKALVVDATEPTVTLSGVGSTNAPYTVTAQFSEDVTLFADTDLTVVNGTVSAFTTVDANTYTFLVTPTISGTTTVDLGATTLTDIAGNPNQAATQLATTVDITAPTVSNVTSSTANGSYKAGQSIILQVVFSEIVNVTGTPQLTLETGATDAVVNYSSGSGTNTLVFNYTLAS